MVRVQATIMVGAPVATVQGIYADYGGWPEVFPTIRAVRLLRQEGSTLVLGIDHVEGSVINELTVVGPAEIRLAEEKRHYDAIFVNRFEAVPGGTRFRVVGDIQLKGVAWVLRPVLPSIARRLMRRLQLEPVQRAAEERVGTGRHEVRGRETA